MATTTATITISSSDLTGDALSLSSTATLTKAGNATGLDQTTGVARKFFAGAHGGDFLFVPYDGNNDIDIDTSDVNMTVEYLVIYEA